MKTWTQCREVGLRTCTHVIVIPPQDAHQKTTTPEHRNHLTKHHNDSGQPKRIAKTCDQHLENLQTDRRIGAHLENVDGSTAKKRKRRTAHVHPQLCKHYNTRRGIRTDNRHHGANRSRPSPQRPRFAEATEKQT